MSNITQIDSFWQGCTGCQACMQICPVQAITMKTAPDGFLYPSVLEERCVDCGLCTKVCTIGKEAAKAQHMGFYSVQAKDDRILSKCSSGGVFPLLAEFYLRRGGLVVGAAFDPQDKQVKHRTTDQVPLEKLLCSKYVQSNVDNSFVRVKEALASNRMVLFCGTPCQVRGLKQFLRIQGITGPLLTVDFKCHGVPSPGLFQAFLKEMEAKYRSSLTNVNFREKDFGWHEKCLKLYFQNGKVWKRPSRFHFYDYYFLNNYSLRDSCYTCEEYMNHASDLTLADDWISPGEKDERGTSLVLLHTKKGADAFAEIYDQLSVKEIPADKLDLTVYRHDDYDQQKKKIWKSAWKEKGYSWVAGPLFRKLSRNMRAKDYPRFYASRIKRKILSYLK